MARLIEFFTPDRRARPRPVRRRRRDAARRRDRARSAARARHRARARAGWRSTTTSSRDLAAERDGAGPRHRRPRHGRPGRPRGVRPVRARAAASATRWRSCRPCRTGSVDFVATDPPYNIQLPLTMAGGTLAETHANRRTDYAMVTDSTGGPRQRRRLRGVPRSDGAWSSASWRASCGPAATRSSSSATPTRKAATGSPARTSRRGPRPSGLVPKGDLIWYQAGTRLRPYGYPRAFVPNIAHQHILVLRKDPTPR